MFAFYICIELWDCVGKTANISVNPYVLHNIFISPVAELDIFARGDRGVARFLLGWPVFSAIPI